MRWVFCSFVLLAVACAQPSTQSPASDWPAGSKVVGAICFELFDGGDWRPLQLELPDGRTPVKGTVFTSALVPPHLLGRIRVRSCE